MLGYSSTKRVIYASIFGQQHFLCGWAFSGGGGINRSNCAGVSEKSVTYFKVVMLSPRRLHDCSQLASNGLPFGLHWCHINKCMCKVKGGGGTYSTEVMCPSQWPTCMLQIDPQNLQQDRNSILSIHAYSNYISPSITMYYLWHSFVSITGSPKKMCVLFHTYFCYLDIFTSTKHLKHSSSHMFQKRLHRLNSCTVWS